MNQHRCGVISLFRELQTKGSESFMKLRGMGWHGGRPRRGKALRTESECGKVYSRYPHPPHEEVSTEAFEGNLQEGLRKRDLRAEAL